MISEKGKSPQLLQVSPNTWTISDFKDFVDSLPYGMHWVYCSAVVTTAFSAGVCTSRMDVLIFKRSDELITCIGYPSFSEFPILHISKGTEGWQELFTPYATTTLQAIAFTYLSGVTHQAGSSKATDKMVFINECVKITANVAKNENLLTLPFSTGFAYGRILQKNSSNATITTSCILNNGVVYPEQDLLLANGNFPTIIITGWK